MGVAQRLREPAERVLRVRDEDDQGIVRELGHGSLHDRRPCAVSERVGHELVAVATVAEREEHAPPLGDA